MPLAGLPCGLRPVDDGLQSLQPVEPPGSLDGDLPGSGAGDPEGRPVDRQHIDPDPACGGWRKRGATAQAIGRSRGGRTTKIHAIGDSKGRLFCFLLTPGHWADVTAAYDLTAQLPARGCLIGDTAYDARKLRQDLAFRGIATIIPTHPTRKHQWPIDLDTYKQRNLVERMFNRLKDFRRIATRYDKLARNFASAIACAAIVLWWTH